MKVLDLFSGIGGFSLGLERAGMETVAFCEYDKKAQLVLKKHWPSIPIFDDVRELTWIKFVQDARKRELEVGEESKRTASHATQSNKGNIELKTKIPETKKTGLGVEKRKKKSLNTTGRSASAAEKPSKNSSASIINTITGTQSEENINHKLGNLLSSGDSRQTIKSSATTAITQNHTMGSAHTEEFRVDVITAGVPCQPASAAGKQRGEGDDRWLWPEALRVISEFHPRWCILENVSGLLALDEGMAFERLCLALEEKGYEVQTLIIPACSLNAPHRRDRLWIVAHSDSSGWRERWGAVTIPPEQLALKHDSEVRAGGHWAVEPIVGRVANGIPRRVDRLKQLGNSVIPQIVEQIGRAIMEIEGSNS